MKKILNLFLSILAVFLLMILPSISAIEYNEISDENESRLKDTLVNENLEFFKNRILDNFEKIRNYLNEEIWSILWDMINDIIGAILIYFVFNAINALYMLLIPPFVSVPLVLMMKLIEFGIYGTIIFDLIRNLFILITNIIIPTVSFSFNTNLIEMNKYI